MANANLCFLEVNHGGSPVYTKWMQHAASDVAAVAFVVDVGAFDVAAAAPRCDGLKHTRIHDSLTLFKVGSNFPAQCINNVSPPGSNPIEVRHPLA